MRNCDLSRFAGGLAGIGCSARFEWRPLRSVIEKANGAGIATDPTLTSAWASLMTSLATYLRWSAWPPMFSRTYFQLCSLLQSGSFTDARTGIRFRPLRCPIRKSFCTLSGSAADHPIWSAVSYEIALTSAWAFSRHRTGMSGPSSLLSRFFQSADLQLAEASCNSSSRTARTVTAAS